jgi:hypothetical protein
MTVTAAPPVGDASASAGPGSSTGGASLKSAFASALPILALVAIPAMVFAGGALIAGHPLLSGDNLIQSFPLRVLVGRELSRGHWPLWDPLIWSGTPLMAGLNAGAFYPTTFVFAILNPAAAWIIGQIFVSSSIGVGMYLFLRATGTGRWASFLSAVTLTFAGAIAAQGAVHMDMGEGFASLPWMLLAVRRALDGGRWRWCLLLAAAFTLLVLSGSPEAILDVTILCLAYGLLRLSLQRSAWSRFLTRVGGGIAIGIGVSAAVWIPALHFIGTSQRAKVDPAFVTAYSFPPRELVLGLVAFLEGGYGLFSQPAFFGQSNLSEVAYYVGMLPVIAAIALLAPSWRAWLPRGERRTWYVIILVGLVLAMAAGSPLEHLMIHIPVYGRQRDQGRNIVDVDVAASVLLAWWLDGGLRPEGARARSEKVAVASILGAIAAVAVWLEVSPTSLWHVLGTFTPPRAALGSLGDAIALAGALALLAAAIALGRRRLPAARWRVLTTAFVFADLVLYTFGTGLFTTQSAPTASDPGALMTLVKANLSPGGRYALYDPDLFYAATIGVSEPDAGIIADLPSVQGYGAIVNDTYANATQTHQRDELEVSNLGDYQPVDLQVMAAPAEEFLTPIAALPAPGAGTVMTPLAEGAGVDPLLPAGNVTLPQDVLPSIVPLPPRQAMKAGEETGWFFGTELTATASVLVLSNPAESQLVRVGEITLQGSLDWLPPQRLAGPVAGDATHAGQTVPIRLPAVPSVGLVIQLLKGPSLGPLQLGVEAASRAYTVNGPLEASLTPLSWTSVGGAGHLAVFRSDSTPVQAWAQPIGSGADASHVAAEVHILSQSDDGATIEVRTGAPAELVRSMAYDPGWHAQIVSGLSATDELREAGVAGGGGLRGSRGTTVRQLGLVQAVGIPAGLSVVRFSYEPEGFSIGVALTGFSLAATALGCIAVVVLSRRKRRREPTRDAPDRDSRRPKHHGVADADVTPRPKHPVDTETEVVVIP